MEASELRSVIAAGLSDWGRDGVKEVRVGGSTLVLVGHGPGGHVVIDRITVPRTLRCEGLGSAAMSEVAAWADRLGVVLALTPTVDFGATSVGRLRKFYRRHGFVANAGGRRDYSVFEAMRRHPKAP